MWNRLAALVFGLLIVGVYLLWWSPQTPSNKITWGLTYSAYQARGIGLDPQTTYTSILDELKPARVRLIAYWNQVEPTPNTYNFSDLDFQVQEAEARHIPYTIVVGQREPRWPECFTPSWAKGQPESAQVSALAGYIKTTVLRYRGNHYLERWQVENETNVGGLFGQCPRYVGKYLDGETKLVRALSDKPILITGGGETPQLGFRVSQYGDVFGTSLYRYSGIGQHLYAKPIPPLLYTWRAAIVRLLHPNVHRVIISELQAEPWASGSITWHDQAYFNRTMSHDKFRGMIGAARQTHLQEVYFWGAEWWYYEKQHGDPYYWDEAGQIFSQSRR